MIPTQATAWVGGEGVAVVVRATSVPRPAKPARHAWYAREGQRRIRHAP